MKENCLYRPLILCTCALSIACAQESITLDKIEVQDHYSVLDERKESSIAKRIVQGEELTQYGDLNALELLKRLPGVTIPEGKRIKGQPGKGYTKVLIDGEEVSTSSKRRGSPLEQLSPEMIERIEVMTNGSAEYTAEAMGGIVNIILKKPKSEGKTIAKIGAGTYNTKAMGNAYVQREGKEGKLAYLINAAYTDNATKDDTSIRDVVAASVTAKTIDMKERYRMLNLNTKLIYTPVTTTKYTFDASMALSDSSTDTDRKLYINGVFTGNVYERDESKGTMFWTKLSGEHHLSGNDLVEWRLKLHQNDQEGHTRSYDGSDAYLQYDDSLFRVVGGEGSYSHLAGDHFIKTGAELKQLSQRDDVRVLKNGAEISDNRQSLKEEKGSLYLLDEVSIGENAVITPGIRYENVSRDMGRDLDYFAPSLHLMYRLNGDDNLRASIAKTVRLPRLQELSGSIDSSLGINDLNHPDVSGNPDLKEEESIGYELRYEHFFEDKGIASIGGFYRIIHDKIEKLITYEGGRYIERPYNRGEGRLWGMELEVKKSLQNYVQGLGVFANATLQNSSLETNGNRRPINGTSAYLYNVGFDHALSPYRLTYGAAYRYVAGYEDGIDENGIAQSQNAHGTLDLYLAKRLDSTFKATLNLKNITGSAITTTTRRYVGGIVVEDQRAEENSNPSILLTLEGKW